MRWASIYPNAISVRIVDSPDVRIIPWFNIFFFVFLVAGIAFLRAMWMQFRERAVDLLLDTAGHHYDEASAGMAKRRGRMLRWLDTWRAKDKR